MMQTTINNADNNQRCRQQSTTQTTINATDGALMQTSVDNINGALTQTTVNVKYADNG
jgi:hypothetical protein